MAIAEESVPCGQGRGMGGGEDKVARRVDEGSLLLGIRSPEDEDKVSALRCQEAYDCVGKLFPPLPLVASCLPGSHGKRGVEQKHALLRPSGKVARRGKGLTEVALYLLEDIDQ